MAALIRRLGNFRSCDSPLSNFHFDALITTAAAVSTYFQKREECFLGLQALALATIADRCISGIYTGDFRIPVNSDEKLISGMLSGVVTAGLEEFVYSYVLLNRQKGFYSTALRWVASFAVGLTASRSLRHTDRGQDLWDAAIGLSWAMSREIVIRKASPRFALIFSIVSNGLIFGLNDRMKFTGLERRYKFITSIAFRWIISYYAQPSVMPPLVAHALFNVSRCLPA